MINSFNCLKEVPQRQYLSLAHNQIDFINFMTKGK